MYSSKACLVGAGECALQPFLKVLVPLLIIFIWKKMNRIFKFCSLSVVIMSSACGGGSSSDESSDFSGTWSGNANVKIDAGDPVCSFFAGEYPISETFTKLSNDSYDVLDSGVSIGTLEVSSGGDQGIINFPGTHNYIPEADLDCHGSETVIITKIDENSITWDYEGVASCGSKPTCEYSGTGTLLKE